MTLCSPLCDACSTCLSLSSSLPTFHPPLSLSFSGPIADYDEAREFIATMFINVNPSRSEDIYPHFTCATDTENIKFIFDVVKNHILQQHITESFGL